MISRAGVLGAIVGLAVGIIVPLPTIEPVFLLGSIVCGYVIGWILTASREPPSDDAAPPADGATT